MFNDHKGRASNVRAGLPAQAGRATQGATTGEVVVQKSRAVGKTEVFTPELFDELCGHVRNGGYWLVNEQLRKEVEAEGFRRLPATPAMMAEIQRDFRQEYLRPWIPEPTPTEKALRAVAKEAEKQLRKNWQW